MTDWLRPVFARAKGPVQSVSNDRPSNFSIDDSNEGEEGNLGRLRPTSRVSSYIGLRPNTPPILQRPDTFFGFRNPESVYHEPSGDQMVEMLKVVMMNRSSTAPVPVEYNSCILQVLEAYYELRMELTRKEETIEELKQNHTRDVKDFEVLATRWDMKEKDYKSELKKLEVLLSRTEGGLEKVSLARSKSAVHGSKMIAEVIGRNITKEGNAQQSRKSRNESLCHFSYLMHFITWHTGYSESIGDDTSNSFAGTLDEGELVDRKAEHIAYDIAHRCIATSDNPS